MNTARRRSPASSLQRLLLKRFGMAALTYALVLVLFGATLLGGLYRGSPAQAGGMLLLVLLSQLVFYGLFRSGCNRRFRDRSLTEPQLLVALFWLSLLLAQLDSARGAFLLVYLLIMLFGVSQLRPAGFARCAAFAVLSFLLVNLWDAWQSRPQAPALVAVQSLCLLVGLFWIGLFASYVQALRARMRQRSMVLRAHQDTLRGVMRQLEELAATDELTGLFNRRHFLRLAAAELEDLDDDCRLGLALIDLDHFKRINDRHGHAVGDRVLQTFATVAQACLREGDVLARYGGEEFVLLLPDCDADRLTSCCERLRLAFAAAEPIGVRVPELSLSAGMTLLGPGDDLFAGLQQADQALYRAKHGGRNRCDAAWENSSA